jgi:uracil phosphoribosyltransferase
MSKIVLHATDLDGYLNEDDKNKIATADKMYAQSLSYCEILDTSTDVVNLETARKGLVENASEIGSYLKQVTSEVKRIHVYSFETPQEQHGEASRLIAKLRSPETQHEEFLYYIQRAYELLFSHVFADAALPNKRSIITKTPVTNPVRNYAVHRIPDVDNLIHNSVMCVMLRGALLPSMILSKEIQDYSSDNFVTPFALFKIKRDETKHESNMDYVLDLDRSFFDLKNLDGKDLVFADPMNATGGSLVTIINYLKSKDIKPKSIKFINVIAALKGSLRICRALPEAEVYTLWMDPVLNDQAYILPGLGDAGDRLNGLDTGEKPRNMIQLIADYGTNIVNLYRAQVRVIEDTVLGK